MHKIAEKHRRFGYRRIGIMLARKVTCPPVVPQS